MATCFQSRISGPWSQVSDRRTASGRVWIFAASAGATCSGLYPSGRCTSIVYPVLRSTRVPIAVSVALADDQVALPVPGHRPVVGLGRTLADVDHVRDPVLPLPGLTAGVAQRPPGAQTPGQLTAQRAARLHIQRLVDRLGGHPHLRIVGELHAATGRRSAPASTASADTAQPSPAAPGSSPASPVSAARHAPRPPRARWSPDTAPAARRCGPAPARSSTGRAPAARRSTASTHPPPGPARSPPAQRNDK